MDHLGGGISALNGAKCKLKACNGKIPSVFQEFWKKLGNVSSGLSAKKFKKKGENGMFGKNGILREKWDVLGKMGHPGKIGCSGKKRDIPGKTGYSRKNWMFWEKWDNLGKIGYSRKNGMFQEHPIIPAPSTDSSRLQ